MGAVFNTPGTRTLIGLLSDKFTEEFTATARDAGLIDDLDPATSRMDTNGFCGKYHLVATGPGAGTINRHWEVWLNHFDAHGGDLVRSEMAKALRNAVKDKRYNAIEFFAVPDTNFSLSTTDHDNGDGTLSLVVLARTPTWDRM